MSELWSFIVGLFGYVMQFCYSISFNNYALALLLYALFFKLLLLPFAIKQQKSSIKMAALRPKMNLIEKKYQGKNDRESLQKKQTEMMELQQKEGYSPMSGCLPLLIQMPIIFALYGVIRQPLTYISHLSSETINALGTMFGLDSANGYYEINILSSIGTTPTGEVQALVGDAILPNLSMWGMDFGSTPSFQNPSLTLIVPFAVFAAQFVSMWLMQKWNGTSANMTKEAAMSNNIMLVTMPLMTLFFAFNFPVALGVYWIYQSLLGLGQSFLLGKIMPVPKFSAEDLKKLEKEAKAAERATWKTQPPKKSLHHIDDDDDEDTVVPAIRSKYDDDGDDSPAEPQVILNGNTVSNTRKKKSNKSKKK